MIMKWVGNALILYSAFLSFWLPFQGCWILNLFSSYSPEIYPFKLVPDVFVDSDLSGTFAPKPFTPLVVSHPRRFPPWSFRPCCENRPELEGEMPLLQFYSLVYLLSSRIARCRSVIRTGSIVLGCQPIYIWLFFKIGCTTVSSSLYKVTSVHFNIWSSS